MKIKFKSKTIYALVTWAIVDIILTIDTIVESALKYVISIIN